jgi:outer membrane protein insertion porin family
MKALSMSGRSRKGLLLSVLVAASMGVSSLALAQNISVRGNSRIDGDSIRRYFVPGPGGFDQASIDKGIEDLRATGLFSTVSARRAGSGVVVTVSENSVINRVRFSGNSKVKTETLEAEIQSRSRGPFSQAMIDADIQRMLEIYRRSGRGAAQITASTAPAASGRTDVTFNIVEGDKTGVAEIRFIGNNKFSAWRLKRQMSTTEMNLLSWLKNSDIYDPDRINADLEMIRRYYLKNGYADFKVVSSNAQFDAAEQGYIVEIVLDEGEQYKIADVRVESQIADVREDELSGAVETPQGSIYSAAAVEQTVDGMSSVVQRKGYAFAQVTPRGDKDEANKTISVVYEVAQGPRVFIERINIRGNTRTREYVVRREFDVGEGDAYNRYLIDRAERRLRNLGYFKSVRISNEPGSAPDRVIVNVDVEDQPTGSFAFAGGYSTTDGWLGEVSLEERNLLGRGQQARVAYSYGERTNGFDISFTDPYFFGQRISFGFDLYSKFQNLTNTAYYESRQTGGALRLGFPISEELSVGFKYSLQHQDFSIPNKDNRKWNDCVDPFNNTTGTSCINNGEASLPIQELDQDPNGILTSMLGANLTYNTLDNLIEPTEGFYGTANLEVAGLGGDSYFARGTADVRYFYPLVEDIVAIARLQGGHVMSINGDPLRITDHFSVGPSLVRGFAPSGIGPRDRSNTNRGALGATTYFGGSLEFQMPVPVLPREFGIKIAAFADAGTAFGYDGKTDFSGVRTIGPNKLNVVDNDDIRSSVGVGLLWSSPLGPIRFDYAWALTKAPGDRTQAFRFQGGTRF